MITVQNYVNGNFVSVQETIEDVIEPYLIQQGYLMRTPRGRLATPKTYEHFGIKHSKKDLNDTLWKE